MMKTKLFLQYPLLMGMAIRFLLAWVLPRLMDGGDVKYTDVDYHVFCDAARYIQQGQSPYQRHTYRYTPFLALLLSKVNGRFLFCLSDALCGKLVLTLRKQQRTGDDASTTTLTDCLLWMYNPLAINICTRGSAESLVVLLPVLLTLAAAKRDRWSLYNRALLTGLLQGVAVHAKLYPVIYTPSYMAYFGRQSQPRQATIHSLSSFVTTWIRRLLQPAPLLFFGAFVASTGGCTYAAVAWYGHEALEQGLLYHLTRIDHRHNYSPWWYPLYLNYDQQTGGVLLVLPQLLLLLATTVAIPDLAFALFVQTFLFVTFNKVVTAQYFTWYLCLLPLCFDNKVNSRPTNLLWPVSWVFVSMLVWLGSAYGLEMQGLPLYRLVWMASLFYFGTNVYLLRCLLRQYGKSDTTKRKKE
jgi:phosphatidylinositol glycan class M